MGSLQTYSQHLPKLAERPSMSGCPALTSPSHLAQHLPCLHAYFVLLHDRFHEIQPQANLKMLPPAPSSRKIVSAMPKCVPYPVLQENTLVLSNFLVVGKRNGKLSLMFRQARLLLLQDTRQK